jgi:hypothetical protein
MSTHDPFKEINMQLQSIDSDIKDLRDSAIRVLEITSKLVQLDPTDKTAQDALDLAKKQLSRFK